MALQTQAGLGDLKQRIDKLLRETNTYSQIRDFIRHQQAENEEGEKNTNGSNSPTGMTAVHSALKEKHVLSQLVKSLRRPPNLADHGGHHSADTHGLSALATPSPFRRFLLLKVQGGRAFVDHTSTDLGSFVLHLHFRNQRFRSRPVACCLEPAFDESFLMDLQSPDSTELVDLATLLALDTKVHIVITQIKKIGDSEEVSLVASYDVEWRKALVAGGVSIPAELLGAGPRSKMRHPVGVLDLRLDVVPAPSTEVPSGDIDRGLRASEARSQDLNRQFFQYSRLWWKEYIEIDPSFKERLVKIFAEDEWGGHRPVCSYVTPLSAGRLLDSPRHAARFVSLIPYTKVEAVGSGSGQGRMEVWNHFHTFLSLGRGDCEDHAILLCSLLIGFGLDAYVCVGTVNEPNGTVRDHVWVITRSKRGSKNGSSPSSSSKSRVVFWETLTGQRYPHRLLSASRSGATEGGNGGNGGTETDTTPNYHLIGCVFNHRCFYANKQANDSVALCNFTFEDDRCWKGMDSEIMVGLEHQEKVPLCPPTILPLELEVSMEHAIRHMVTSLRRNELRLSTDWDDQLSYMLGPALCAYEMERLTGAAFGNDEFQDSIKRNVPEGHTFRGYPIVVNDSSPANVLGVFRRAQIATDILRTRGDAVRFALRVKVFVFPENVKAIWVMLACKFKP